MGEYDVLTIVIGALELHGYKPTVAKLGTDGHASAAYKTLIADYQRAFCRFSKDVLEEGMARFKDDWTFAGWPKIAQLRGFMIAAERVLRPAIEDKRPKEQPDTRNEAYWARYRAETARISAEQDEWDRAHGVEPLGRPASDSTHAERRAYQARRDVALAKHYPWLRMGVKHVSRPGTTGPSRERQREASKQRAGEEMEVSDGKNMG
jgi:hypothetical protein